MALRGWECKGEREKVNCGRFGVENKNQGKKCLIILEKLCFRVDGWGRFGYITGLRVSGKET